MYCTLVSEDRFIRAGYQAANGVAWSMFRLSGRLAIEQGMITSNFTVTNKEILDFAEMPKCCGIQDCPSMQAMTEVFDFVKENEGRAVFFCPYWLEDKIASNFMEVMRLKNTGFSFRDSVFLVDSKIKAAHKMYE